MWKRISTNLGLKITALLVACVVWFIIMNIDDPTDTKSFSGISVTVMNESVITNQGKIYQAVDGSDVVTVTVKAKRSVLSKIRKEDIVAVADIKNMQMEQLVPVVVSITNYEGRYDEAVAMPRNMEIIIEDNESQTLPISVNTVGNVEEGYFVQNVSVIPESVTVSGPKSKINQIKTAGIDVNVTGLREPKDFTGKVQFYDEAGILIDDDLLTSDIEQYPTVHVEVAEAKKVPVRVEVYGQPEEGYELKEVNYDPKEIYITGKKESLNQVEEIYIYDDVLNITGAVDDVEVVIDLTDYLPEGISLADSETDKLMATAVIEKYGTRTIKYPVGSIVVNNAPEGYKVSYNGISEISLIFSGSEKMLQELAPENIDVSIDLSDIKNAGVFDVKVSALAWNGCILTNDVIVSIVLEKE